MKTVHTMSTLVLFLVAFTTGCTSSDDEDPVPVAEGFFDDFSVDSLRLTVDRRKDESVSRDYQVENDRIVIRASSTNGERAQAYIDPWGRSDSITARIALSSESELPDDAEARAVARITGTFYNDTQDNGYDGVIGDVGANIQLSLHGDGQREAFFCVGREGDDNLTFIDGSNCGGFDGFELELDTKYTVSIQLDRQAATLTFSINEMSKTFDVGGPVFLPANDRRRVQITHEGVSGQTVASVFAVGNDDYFQDFTNDAPVIGPYQPFFDLEHGDGRTLDVINGRAHFVVPSVADNDARLSLTYLGESDRIQAIMELASSSTLTGEQPTDDNAIRMRLGGTFYNDTADGGFNDSEGDVFASINLRSDPAETVVLEYCAYRSNTADFSDAVELIQEAGSDCGEFGVSADYDVPYAVSITVDRTAGTMIFVANDIERQFDIPTVAFAPPEKQFINVQARSANGSTAVAFVDDFGTSANAPPVVNQ
jgi:hypothetical protein